MHLQYLNAFILYMCVCAFCSYTQDAPTSDKLDIEQRLILEASAPWILSPVCILMHHAARAFQVRLVLSCCDLGVRFVRVRLCKSGV